MEPTTIRLSENTLETLASEAGARGRSRSEYIREIINDRHADDRLRDDYEAQIADYEERIDTLETENERLRRQLAATNARQDDVDRWSNTSKKN